MANGLMSVDQMAPVTTGCFLVTFACANLACFVQTVASRTFQPKFRFYSLWTSLLGALLSIVARCAAFGSMTTPPSPGGLRGIDFELLAAMAAASGLLESIGVSERARPPFWARGGPGGACHPGDCRGLV